MLFSDISTVKGENLAGFLRWARDSFEWTLATEQNDDGVLALPPIQRSAAWNPKQVVEIWDSVFRGLPLGAFMLQRRAAQKPAIGLGADARSEARPAGWDLLDGQQRVRSLLLGMYGPDLRRGRLDKRCLWINLDGKSDRYLFDLHLTSASQPFGYQENGYKLSPGMREAARNRYEPLPAKVDPINRDKKQREIRNNDRRAYNHELFGGFIEREPNLELHVGDQSWPMPPEQYPGRWPPPPTGVKLSVEQTPKSNGLIDGSLIMPMHVIFEAWRAATCANKKDALAQVIDPGLPCFQKLFDALRHFDKAEIALVNTTSVTGNNIPLLYDRIGAGGTALSNEERLFSFYKFHRHDFHDIVQEIYQTHGHVMARSKIAASAIRIANSLAYQQRDQDQPPDIKPRPDEGNGLPDISAFVKAIEQPSTAEDHVNIRVHLDDLLDAAKGSRFTKAFDWLFEELEYDKTRRPLGLPKVLLWRLPPNLVQVLLFWRLHANNQQSTNSDDLIRFVIFWLLCSWNDDKTSNECFKVIRENNKISLQTLCQRIHRNDLARTLIEPEQMTRILVLSERQPLWRTLQARVESENPQIGELVGRWWRDDANVMPWLQRAYLDAAFRDFDPTADREDDTPYDVDHMVPSDDWGRNWGYRDHLFPLSSCITEERREKQLRWVRFEIGNSIGNKWLVDYSSNRSWGNKGFQGKLDDVADGSDQTLRRLLDVFPCENKALWVEASPDSWTETPATDDRLSKFQEAIERRAAWLYRRLYDDLGFSVWLMEMPSKP